MEWGRGEGDGRDGHKLRVNWGDCQQLLIEKRLHLLYCIVARRIKCELGSGLRFGIERKLALTVTIGTSLALLKPAPLLEVRMAA